jgi:hypothetical protein
MTPGLARTTEERMAAVMVENFIVMEDLASLRIGLSFRIINI